MIKSRIGKDVVYATKNNRPVLVTDGKNNGWFVLGDEPLSKADARVVVKAFNDAKRVGGLNNIGVYKNCELVLVPKQSVLLSGKIDYKINLKTIDVDYILLMNTLSDVAA